MTHYLSDSVVKHIDTTTLVPQKDSFIDEKLEETYSDLLFQANIFVEKGYVFLFEHKSYPDKGIALQISKKYLLIFNAVLKN